MNQFLLLHNLAFDIDFTCKYFGWTLYVAFIRNSALSNFQSLVALFDYANKCLPYCKMHYCPSPVN